MILSAKYCDKGYSQAFDLNVGRITSFEIHAILFLVHSNVRSLPKSFNL